MSARVTVCFFFLASGCEPGIIAAQESLYTVMPSRCSVFSGVIVIASSSRPDFIRYVRSSTVPHHKL